MPEPVVRETADARTFTLPGLRGEQVMGQRSDKTQLSIATVGSAVRLPPQKEQPRDVGPECVADRPEEDP